MRFLLVDCLARGSGSRKATVDVIGAGPRVVAGILESFGYRVRVDVPEKISVNILKRYVEEYDALLISAMSSDLGIVRKLTRLWRNLTRKPIIIGGPITGNPLRISELEFDVGFYGESEETLIEICSRKLFDSIVCREIEKLKSIKGLILRVNNEIVFTGRRRFVSKELLNTINPSTKIVKYYPLYWASRVYVEIVRGCSNFNRPKIVLPSGKKCILCYRCKYGPLRSRLECPIGIPPGCGYCSVPALYGPPRSRHISNIVSEIKGLIRNGVSRIVLSAPDILDYCREELVEPEPLTDPCSPPPNIDALRRLFDSLFNISEIASGEVALMLENIKACLVNEEVAKLLGEYFKGTTVHIGCETGDQEHADLIGRPGTVDDVVRAVKLLTKYGLRPYVYFIHGLPGQSPKTVNNTLKIIDILKQENVEKITLYRFSPLPGSAFEDYPRAKPFVKDKLSLMIARKVQEVNIQSKYKLLNRIIKVVIVGEYKKKYIIGYPFYHGPVVLFDKSVERYIGFLVKARIVRVLSDRLVYGTVESIERRVHQVT